MFKSICPTVAAAAAVAALIALSGTASAQVPAVTVAASASATAAPPNQPGTPSLTAGNAAVTVTWTAPTAGAAPTLFSVRCFNGTGSSRCAGQPSEHLVPAGQRSLVVPGLVNGSNYSFDVRAYNLSGYGVPSARSAAAAPQAPLPGLVLKPATTPGNAQVSLSWSAPAAGDPPTGYRIRCYNGGGSARCAGSVTEQTVPASQRSVVIGGLVNGSKYSFDVTAFNTFGLGTSSERSATITPAPPLPGQVPKPKVVAGSAEVTVTWTAPSNGDAASGYRVRCFNGAGSSRCAGAVTEQTVAGNQMSLVVKGLTNGSAYSFDVTAYNTFGFGTGSERSAVATTVTPLPGQSPKPTATAGTGSATVAWAAPPAGAVPTGYRIRCFNGIGSSRCTGEAAELLVLADQRQLTVGGLIAGSAYSFEVVAFNTWGDGTRSERSVAVTVK